MPEHSPEILQGLSSELFEHPTDRAVLNRLKSLPGMGEAVGTVVDFYKRQIELDLLANAIRVTAESMPELYEIYAKTCHILDISQPYPILFVKQDPFINGYTTGADFPYICLTSGALQHLSSSELLYLLGHELGHVMAGHVRYKALVQICVNITQASGIFSQIAAIPINVIATPVLMLWSRRSEYTADRAGLLACQSTEVAYAAIMKLAGFYSLSSTLNTKALLTQAQEFRQTVQDDSLDNIFDLSNHLYASHPRIVERVAELEDWIESGAYSEILELTPNQRLELKQSILFLPEDQRDLFHKAEKILMDWYQKEFAASSKEAFSLIRTLLYSPKSLPPGFPVLQVEIEVMKVSSEDLEYRVHLLHNRQGKFIKTTLDLFQAKWDESPKQVRNALIQSRAAEKSFFWRIFPGEKAC